MNYKKHYDTLIERARNRKLDEYTENHHIKPRCMGGTDDPDNLVRLTADEHFVAHQLLVKMYPEHSGLINAVFYMTCGNEFRGNKTYAWHRKKLVEFMKENQSGEGNSQYGTRWIHNVELQKSKKIKKDDILPDGWQYGRVIDFDNFNNDKNKTTNLIGETTSFKMYPILHKKNLNMMFNAINARRLYDIFNDGKYSSLRAFCKSEHYDKSVVSLSKMWKTYVPEFNPKHGKRYKI